MPKQTSEELLERMVKYFSFMGEITETKLQKQNNLINEFAGQIRSLYTFLEVITQINLSSIS